MRRRDIFQACWTNARTGLVGHALAYIGAAALNAAIPFLLLPLVARWLGPTDFGVVGSYVAFVNVLILFVSLNTTGFISVGFYREGAAALPQLVTAAIVVMVTTTAIIAPLGWLLAGPIENLTGISAPWLWTVLAAAMGQSLITLGLTVAQTTKRPQTYAVLQLGYGMLMACLTLLLVGALGMGWSGRAMAQALAALLLAGAVLCWLARGGRIKHIPDRNTVSSALRFGVPLLPHSFAIVAIGSMDRAALGGSFGPAVVGHYFLAFQISSIFTALAGAVNQAWVPWLYERLARGHASDWSEIRRVTQIGGFLLLLGALLMATMAKPIVELAGGPQFSESAGLLSILSFYAVFQAWYSLMLAFLFYQSATRTISAISVAAAGLLALGIWLLLPYGAKGVAIALLASGIASAIAASILAVRVTKSVRNASSAVAASGQDWIG